MALANDYTQEPLDHSVIHLLHKVGQYGTDVFASEAGESGLTPRQFAVLAVIETQEGLSQTDLVEITGIDRSTLADIVRRMLKKGLVARKRTREDQRTYAIKLSAVGRRILDQHKPAAETADATILGAVPAELQGAFLRALDAIVQSGEERRKAKAEADKSEQIFAV